VAAVAKPMNSLEQLLSRERLDEVAALNAIQSETNLISDLCVRAADVAGKDCFAACQWILENKERFET